MYRDSKLMKNIFIILLLINTSYCFCQKNKSNYFNKATTVEVTTMVNNDSIQAMLDDYERIQLPPLSVFLVVCLIHLKQPINGTYYNYPCNNKNHSHHVGITIIIICHRCFVQV